MQLKQHVLKEFLFDSPDHQVTTGGHIVQNLTLNEASFPALPFPVATLTTTNATYLTLIEQAKEGSKSAIAARNNQAKVWKSQFKATADYVDHLANGNAEIITKAGMTPTKAETAPRQAPDSITNPKCAPIAQPGTIEISVRADKNVDAYLYLALPAGTQCTAATDGMLSISLGGHTFYVKCDTHASTLMSDLVSGQALDVLVQPINNVGAGPIAGDMHVTPQ